MGSKTRSTHDLHPSTPRDPTDFAGPMKFCVIGMLVNVINTIHGNFGAVDPIRFNCKHESYLWGDKHVTRFNLHQERLPKHVLLWLTVADGATNAKGPVCASCHLSACSHAPKKEIAKKARCQPVNPRWASRLHLNSALSIFSHHKYN